MNPEFARNLALEFTPRRRLGIPLVVGFLLGSAFMANDYEFGPTTAGLSLFIFTVIIYLWGTRLAAESVVEEINQRTWDRQRMCALTAWQLTWGKLLGKTAPAWTGGLMALLAYGLSIHEWTGTGGTLLVVALYGANGVLAQVAAFAASLLAVQRRRKFGRIQLISYQVIGVVCAAPTLYLGFSSSGLTDFMNTVAWYGRLLTLSQFLSLWVGSHLLWVVAAAWLLMRVELQQPHGPWAWLAFLAFSWVFWNGLETLPIGITLEATGTVPELPDAPAMGFWAAAAAVYLLAAIEPKDRVTLERLVFYWREKRWRWWLAAVPRAWVTLPVAATAALYAALYDGTSWGGQTNVFLVRQAFPVMFLLVIRDLAVFHAISLLRPDGRGEGLAVLLLIVVYGLMPGLMEYLGIGFLAPLFASDLKTAGGTELLIAAAEAAGAVALVWWLWRTPRRRPDQAAGVSS